MEDLEGAISRVRERLSRRSFVKAVGKSAARDIEVLLKFAERHSECLMISVDEANKAYLTYVAAESKIRGVLRSILEVLATLRSREFAAIYAFLPEDVRQYLMPLLGSSIDRGVEESLNMIMGELSKVNEVLVKLVKEGSVGCLNYGEGEGARGS